MITVGKLNAILPFCQRAADWTAELNSTLPTYGIITREQVAAFLGQVAVESNELNVLTENLNYSADALRIVWPRRFITPELAKRYHRQPQKIANYVYANRLGNGDEASGDGWKFRGHGLIQTTGRTNINAALAALGLPLDDPSPLATPRYAAKAAGVYWRDRGCNALVDDDVALTERVNGGQHGLAKRRAYRLKALEVL